MEEQNEKARIGASRNLARDLIKKSKIKEAPVSLRVVITHLQSTHNLGVYTLQLILVMHCLEYW